MVINNKDSSSVLDNKQNHLLHSATIQGVGRSGSSGGDKGLVDVVIRDEPEIDNERFGARAVVIDRATEEIVTSRYFMYKGQFRMLVSMAGWLYAARRLDGISQDTHYILVKPTYKHKIPKWVFKKLKDKVRVDNGING